jgi:DNA polymerase III delta prime subunit
LDEIIGQDHLIHSLLNLSLVECPHVFIEGPHGVGKTCVVKLWTSSLFASSVLKDQYVLWLTLNHISDGALSFIKEYILPFLNTYMPCNQSAPFKMVVIDNAHFLADQSQDALRRVMEEHAETRFVFISTTDFAAKDWNEAILSRCALFRASYIDANDLNEFTNRVAKKLDLEVPDEHICRQFKNPKQVLAFFHSSSSDIGSLNKKSSIQSPLQICEGWLKILNQPLNVTSYKSLLLVESQLLERLIQCNSSNALSFIRLITKAERELVQDFSSYQKAVDNTSYAHLKTQYESLVACINTLSLTHIK